MCAHLLQGPSKLYENSCEAGTEGVLKPGFKRVSLFAKAFVRALFNPVSRVQLKAKMPRRP